VGFIGVFQFGLWVLSMSQLDLKYPRLKNRKGKINICQFHIICGFEIFRKG
jgi:hypothetical protein